MRLKLIRISSFLLLIAWMIMIFCLSAQDDTESSRTSSGFTHMLFSVFYPGFSDMDEISRLEIISNIMFYVRKAAHFSIYCILGALSFFAVITYEKPSLYFKGVISWSVCVLYSVSDELHQRFVSGRSCELRDVLIDSAGALLSTVILLAVWRIRAHFKSTRNGR